MIGIFIVLNNNRELTILRYGKRNQNRKPTKPEKPIIRTGEPEIKTGTRRSQQKPLKKQYRLK